MRHSQQHWKSSFLGSSSTIFLVRPIYLSTTTNSSAIYDSSGLYMTACSYIIFNHVAYACILYPQKMDNLATLPCCIYLRLLSSKMNNLATLTFYHNKLRSSAAAFLSTSVILLKCNTKCCSLRPYCGIWQPKTSSYKSVLFIQ